MQKNHLHADFRDRRAPNRLTLAAFCGGATARLAHPSGDGRATTNLRIWGEILEGLGPSTESALYVDAGTSSISVISAGAPTRIGGPQ